MKSKTILLLILFCCLGTNAISQSVFPDPLVSSFADDEIQTVPSFNCCSYYFRPSADAAIRVEYKRQGEAVWQTAHATVCDQPEKIHKGGLFSLAEDTEYQLRILSETENKIVAQKTFRTWSSNPRIGKTIDLSTLPDAARDGIVITEQGRADAWIRYTAPEGWIVRRSLRDADKQDGVYSLLVRIPTTSSRSSKQGFDITLDGDTSEAAASSGYWYLSNDTEQVIWLYSFGKLKAGTKRLTIKPVIRKLGAVEYIVTDNPAAFFFQGENRKTNSRNGTIAPAQ